MGRTAPIGFRFGPKMNRALMKIDDLSKQLMWLCNLTLMLGIAAIVWFASERSPPFVMLSVEPATARPGDYLTIRAAVKRDITRECSAQFSRFIFDSSGARYDIGASTSSAEMIRTMEIKTPGQLVVTFKLPDNISPGPSNLTTVLEYRCNKVHRFWPIDVTLHMPFVVRQ